MPTDAPPALARIDSVAFSGVADIDASGDFSGGDGSRREIPGWIAHIDTMRGPFSNDAEPQRRFGSNGRPCILVTGNRHWTDATHSCRFNVHSADRAGILLRYQGMQRYILLEFTRTSARIVRQRYGETVLAETPFRLEENRMVDLEASAEGDLFTLRVYGRVLLSARDDAFADGGVGSSSRPDSPAPPASASVRAIDILNFRSPVVLSFTP